MPIIRRLKTFSRNQDFEHTIELKLKGDFARPLAEFFNEIGKIGAGGHSFSIEADREDNPKGQYPKVGFDGDGADRIVEILFDGKRLK